jgi:hypothetical protein
MEKGVFAIWAEEARERCCRTAGRVDRGVRCKFADAFVSFKGISIKLKMVQK